jgi:hypothetical protein
VTLYPSHDWTEYWKPIICRRCGVERNVDSVSATCEPSYPDPWEVRRELARLSGRFRGTPDVTGLSRHVLASMGIQA